jgi:hypothetical protein
MSWTLSQSATKPAPACDPSQQGLLRECPQRHSVSAVVRFTLRRAPEQIPRLPRTRSSPLRYVERQPVFQRELYLSASRRTIVVAA